MWTTFSKECMRRAIFYGRFLKLGVRIFFSTWIMRLMSTIFSIRKRIQVGKSSRLPSKNKSKIRCIFRQGIIGEWWVTVLKSNVGLSLEIKLLWARVFDPQAASSIRVKNLKISQQPPQAEAAQHDTRSCEAKTFGQSPINSRKALCLRTLTFSRTFALLMPKPIYSIAFCLLYWCRFLNVLDTNAMYLVLFW